MDQSSQSVAFTHTGVVCMGKINCKLLCPFASMLCFDTIKALKGGQLAESMSLSVLQMNCCLRVGGCREQPHCEEAMSDSQVAGAFKS